MIELRRIKYTDKSVQGELYIDGALVAYTLENAWKKNKKRVSCIPSGEYKLIFDDAGRFNDRYGHQVVKLDDVPDRSEILIHKGNYPKDTQGCILVGSSAGDDAVWSSSKAYDRVYKKISQKIIDNNKVTIKVIGDASKEGSKEISSSQEGDS